MRRELLGCFPKFNRVVKRSLFNAISSLGRSAFSARGYALRAESRAEAPRKCAQGQRPFLDLNSPTGVPNTYQP